MYVIRLRRGSSTEWEESNPILQSGEIGFDTTVGAFKIGDGVTPWNDIPNWLQQGPQGIQGPVGPVGPRGDGITIQDVVADYVSLPGSANTNDLYITSDTQDGWVWDGATWINIGPMQGPQGIQGIQGPQGETGPQGPAGPAGIWWSGTLAEYDAIVTKDPNTLYVIVG